MNFNLILIGFIVGIIVLMVVSAFNKLRQNDIQKNYCARTLSEVAKLWRRAKFVPEDAKERESFYLYRDFLRKFEGENCIRPLTLKNGGVRCMSRQEFDKLAKFKPVKPTSLLFTIASVLVAIIAIVANFMTNSILLGLGLAVILPIVQVIIMLFLKKMIKEKDIYRDGIFLALKENCVNFVSITKPYVVVDAYPDKFGKNAKPLYVAKGEPSAEQIREIHDFIALQKEIDRNFEPRPINNQAIREQINAIEQERQMAMQKAMSTDEPVVNEPITVEPAPTNPVPTAENDLAQTPTTLPNFDESIVEPNTEATAEDNLRQIIGEDEGELTPDKFNEVIDTLIDSAIMSDIERAIKEAEQGQSAEQNSAQQTDVVSTPTDIPVTQTQSMVANNETDVIPTSAPTPAPEVEDQPFSVDAPLVDEGEPAEDDFSLEAIGRALDAEIAKRNAKK